MKRKFVHFDLCTSCLENWSVAKCKYILTRILRKKILFSFWTSKLKKLLEKYNLPIREKTSFYSVSSYVKIIVYFKCNVTGSIINDLVKCCLTVKNTEKFCPNVTVNRTTRHQLTSHRYDYLLLFLFH